MEQLELKFKKKTKVEFKKLYEDSILPKKAHETDAGFDLYGYIVARQGVVRCYYQI